MPSSYLTRRVGCTSCVHRDKHLSVAAEAMGDADPDTSSPETDAEEWSEDTLPSSPQHAGYQPLDQGYEALEDDQQEQEQQEEHQQAEEHQQQAEDAVEEGSLSGGDENSQQPDVRRWERTGGGKHVRHNLIPCSPWDFGPLYA